MTLLIVTVLVAGNAFAISESFDTSISAVYPCSDDDFAMNALPLNTSFMFYAHPQILPDDFVEAYVRMRLGFSFANSSFGGYEYNTGTPKWRFKKADSLIDETNRFEYFKYFKPTGNIDINIEQGFLTNPLYGSGNLIEIALGFRSNYFQALEPLKIRSGNTNTTFMDPDGNYTGLHGKFAPGNTIQAYPWLEGNRSNLSNHLYTYIEIMYEDYPGFGIADGLYTTARLDYGPYWLGNTLSGNTTSDFLSASLIFQQRLSLYSHKQKNGMNWLSIELVHRDTIETTQGNVVPVHMLPNDRLNSNFRDSIYLNFVGPQFLTGDSYTYMNLGLNNTLSWGNVVNEYPQKTKALEYESSIYMLLHLRLFGFMHFEYSLNYTFGKGIHPVGPNWSHNNKLSFYITV